MENPKEFYTAYGAMTAPGAHAADLSGLPTDLAASCEVIQGLLIHQDLASFLYGVTLSDEQRLDAHIRPLAQRLARIRALDSRALTIAREPAHRMPGVCSHFSLMLCARLREQGIPARPRCGFGAYFTPGKFEDHWVCEYWNSKQERWILVDAQLDAPQRKTFNVDFSPLDVPRDRFIIAGDAWQMCRSGRADPDKFGLSFMPDLHGLWFIAGNIVRDLASLNRMEMLPWDVWGSMPRPGEPLKDEQLAFFDKIAALTLAPDSSFAELRRLYESDERLRVPRVVFNALHNAPETVATF
jgi:Transglutaminase-like superfamily